MEPFPDSSSKVKGGDGGSNGGGGGSVLHAARRRAGGSSGAGQGDASKVNLAWRPRWRRRQSGRMGFPFAGRQATSGLGWDANPPDDLKASAAAPASESA